MCGFFLETMIDKNDRLNTHLYTLNSKIVIGARPAENDSGC